MRPIVIYLNNHLAASNAGVHTFFHAAKHLTAYREELEDLAAQVTDDRDQLRDIMSALDVKEIKPLTLVGGTAGRVLRLRPSGRLLRRGPLSDLLELEALRDAVSAKLAGWYALKSTAERDGTPSVERIDRLIERAHAQIDSLHVMHQKVAAEALHPMRGHR